MTIPGHPVGPLDRPLSTHRPPPIEAVAEAYFSPLLAPTPVGTRVPMPSNTADTINGFLRVESGGGTLRGELLLWDVAIILHAYAPNTQEHMAEQLMTEALAWGSNAGGSTQVMPNGDEWYVTYSRCTGFSTRRPDPLVNLTRYRGMVTWRMPGLPMVPGARRVVVPPPKPPSVSDAAVADAPRPSRRRR